MSTLNTNSLQFLSVTTKDKVFLLRSAIFSLLLFWCFGFLIPILFTSSRNPFFEFIISNLYSTVCHQQNEKCFSMSGTQMLVCARCSGIYFGALTTALVSMVRIKLPVKKKFLLLVLLMMTSDILLVMIGAYNYSKPIAFLTGLSLGVVVYLYLIKELEIFFFVVNKNINR